MPFSIKKNSAPIYIYGAGALGKSYAKKMLSAGFNIIGFLDINAHAINEETLPVFLPRHVEGTDAIIIVCMHDALWHEDAVKYLKQLKQNNVLFIPTADFHNQLEMQKMLSVYNAFECGDYYALDNIPTLSELDAIRITIENSIISQNNSSINLWIDITYLYSSVSETKNEEGISQYCYTPMPGMTPYVNLFKYLNGTDCRKSYAVPPPPDRPKTSTVLRYSCL